MVSSIWFGRALDSIWRVKRLLLEAWMLPAGTLIPQTHSLHEKLIWTRMACNGWTAMWWLFDMYCYWIVNITFKFLSKIPPLNQFTIRSAFAKAFPETVDEKFNEHWYLASFSILHTLNIVLISRSTWFNQTDVDALKGVGINTVRVPVRSRNFHLCDEGLQSSFAQLGFWIVEAIVDRTTEFYPRGGILQLVSTP